MGCVSCCGARDAIPRETYGNDTSAVPTRGGSGRQLGDLVGIIISMRIDRRQVAQGPLPPPAAEVHLEPRPLARRTLGDVVRGRQVLDRESQGLEQRDV